MIKMSNGSDIMIEMLKSNDIIIGMLNGKDIKIKMLNGRDITTIGLQDLRARLTIIPQVYTALSVLNDYHAYLCRHNSTRQNTFYQRPIGQVNFSSSGADPVFREPSFQP